MNEFNFDTPKTGEKITSIWHCRYGKFRLTAEEERQIFSQNDKSQHPMLRLLEIRKEKKKSEIAGL